MYIWITQRVQEYCAHCDIFLFECSSQKRQEEHCHTDGREEEHRHAHHGDGCYWISNCFLHNAIIFKCIKIDVYIFVAVSVKFHRCYNEGFFCACKVAASIARTISVIYLLPPCFLIQSWTSSGTTYLWALPSAAGLPFLFDVLLIFILNPLRRDAVGLNDYITFSSLARERTKNLLNIVAPW